MKGAWHNKLCVFHVTFSSAYVVVYVHSLLFLSLQDRIILIDFSCVNQWYETEVSL